MAYLIKLLFIFASLLDNDEKSIREEQLRSSILVKMKDCNMLYKCLPSEGAYQTCIVKWTC
jgi:hypothetical protein